MRAVRYDEFGPADVLRVVDVDIPAVRPGEVLVRVRAAGVGGGETAIRAGRLQAMLPHRPPAGVGTDFAGHVAATGPGVQRFRDGDAVWGLMPHLTFGSAAEYVAVPEARLAPAPRDVDLVAAAALPSSGTTALTALTPLRPGQRLLVRGGAGGVGSLAVQLGRSRGAHVTALVSDRDREWIRQLGADSALDYRSTAPADAGLFDVVLDLVGTDAADFAAALTPQGRLVALALDPDQLPQITAFMTDSALARSGRLVSFSNDPTADGIAALTRAVESGELRPVVDTVYPLDKVAEAHRRLEAGGVRGKLVVEM